MMNMKNIIDRDYTSVDPNMNMGKLVHAISHLKLTSNGLIEIYLKNESFTYSSRRYLKAIKEKLEL